MLTFPRTNRARGRESLDDECLDPILLRAEFAVLRRLNRATAASAALVAAIGERVAPTKNETVSLVDFGCGGGDIVSTAIDLAAQRGWHLRATATDRSPACIAVCRAAAGSDSIDFKIADLLRNDEEWSPKSFDVAHASLVIHHFTDDNVVTALRRLSDSARKLVVWNDLVRDRIGVMGAIISTIDSPAIVRQDAILSVRRGFTLAEATAFAEAAGLEDIRICRWHGARFVLTGRPSQDGSGGRARPLVRASGVAFSFGSHLVVDDWSMLVRAGEVALLEGPNGSGKSTIMRLFAGVLQPRSGRVWCDQVNGPVGYLPQHGGLVSALDLGENIAMLQSIAGVPRSERADRARDAIARFNVGSLLSRPTCRLSIGQSRCAALASVFALAGHVLLLDEPDAGLDAHSRERLGKAIIERTRAGHAVVVASHEPSWLDSAVLRSRAPLHRSLLE